MLQKLLLGMDANTPPHKKIKTENASPFISLSDFSTDPSQQSRYTPITREEWSHHCESVARATSASTSASASASAVKVEKTATVTLEKESKSPIELLDELMPLVQPREGKERAVRSVSRELRSAIQKQTKKLTKDCPKFDVPENIRAWSTGIPGQCSECGMNHFVLELHRIGNQLYGATALERKSKIAKWLEEGTGEYIASIRKK